MVMETTTSRLPKFVIPELYELELWVLDLNAPPPSPYIKFQGRLQIRLHILKSTAIVLLNSAGLTINQASLLYSDHTDDVPTRDQEVNIQPETCTVDEDNELLALQFATALPVGRSTLCLDYHGLLNEKLDGFYRGTYNIGGVTKNMAVTDFQPSDARRCFPCWDEPNFKASFKFAIHAPADRMVLSNMPILEEKIITVEDTSTKVVKFQESPPMSTYVVALVIGEFEYMEAFSKDGVCLRVYTQPGDLHKSKFGFDIMVELLPFYAEYFQLNYPLPKLDIVSVPEFKCGALEDFGLIIFRDIALFADENSSPSQKQEVAITVAHEVAHMWFGDIVTLDWWTHIWLNEGMATWISYMAVDHLFPNWNIWMEFHDVIMYGLTMDAHESTHPIEVEVVHARETMEVFDAIGYFKGASIIYMLQHYLGPTDLQKGLALYMQKFAFGNAKSDDLWNCFHEVTKKPIRELMNSWTKQKGFPIVNAKLLDAGRELLIEQSQFCANGQEIRANKGQWSIPVTICSPTCKFHRSFLLEEEKLVISIPPSQALKLNFEQSGFYRVDYDDQLLAALGNSVTLGGLTSAIDRLGLLDDLFALCQARKKPLTSLLSLLEVYKNDADPTVLSKMTEISVSVSSIMVVAIPSLSQKLKSFLAKLLETPARKLGWEGIEGESHLDAILRERLLHALVMLDHKETTLEARKRFETKFASPLASNMRKAVYTSIMKEASTFNKHGYNVLLKVYRSSNNIAERSQALGMIGASSSTELLVEALNFSLSSEVRPQDMPFIFSNVLLSNGPVCWNWLKENWKMMFDKLGEGYLLRSIIESITSKLWSDGAMDEVQTLLSSHMSSFKHLGDRCSEMVKLNAGWITQIRNDETILKQIDFHTEH